MKVHSLTILPGKNRSEEPENFPVIEVRSGETISIVGPTGSGKTALMTDIELLAQKDTITQRKILINGMSPDENVRFDPALKPVTMITQNTKCFADITVEEFLGIHIRARKMDTNVIDQTIRLANQFTGEPVEKQIRITCLSGGQTRSLLIADALMIGLSPIILLDEVENAGINKKRVIEIVSESNKIAVFSTHDPVIALLTERRIVMQRGEITKIIYRDATEAQELERLILAEKELEDVRQIIRSGNKVSGKYLGKGACCS